MKNFIKKHIIITTDIEFIGFAIGFTQHEFILHIGNFIINFTFKEIPDEYFEEV